VETALSSRGLTCGVCRLLILGWSMDMRGAVRLVSLVSDAEWERHIRDSLGPSTVVRWIRRESDLDVSDGLETANVVLWQIAATPSAASTLASTLRRVRATMPTAPVVLYCQVAPTVAQLVVQAAKLGVHRAALRGYDNLAWILADTLREHTYSTACEEILAHTRRLDDRVLPVVAYCVRRAFDCVLSVDGLARAFQVDRKTLHNHLRRGSLPAAAALISWSRLLAAGWLLENPERTIASVARVVHFASPSEFRGMLSRYVHATATQLRSAGSLRTIAHAFRYECARCRVRMRSARPSVMSVSRRSIGRASVTSPGRDGDSPMAD
jgi:AraC-like DNA-binding protein